MSNQLFSGQGRVISVPDGQSLAVSSIQGAYTATIVSGAGAGTALATDSTGGATYGPYAGNVEIHLRAGEGGLIDFEAAVSPVLNYDGGIRAGYNASGDVASLVDQAGNAFRMAVTSGVLLAGFGDSITYQNTNGSSLVLRAVGYASWAAALSGGRLLFSNSLNFGVPGDSTTQALARADAAVAAMKTASCQYCVVHLGTNDVYAGGGIATDVSIANLGAIYAKFLNAGITPILMPIIPRAKDDTSGSMLTADRQKQQRVNNWIRDYAASTPGVIIADPTTDIVDHSVTNGDPIGALTASTTAFTYDGVHPSPRAAYFMGKAISDAMASRLVGISRKAWSQADTYSATNNPSGNLLANGFLTGTSGTAGTGTTGSVATSWTARRQSGSTGALTASKGTIATGNGTTYPSQVLSAAAPAGSSSEIFQLYQQIFSNFSAGDVVVAECDISVSGVTVASLKEMFLQCADDTQQARHLQSEGSFYMPDQSWSGTLRTLPLTLAPGATVITTTVQFTLDGTVSSNAAVITVSRVRLAKQ